MSEFEDTCRLCLRQSQEKMVNAAQFDGVIAMVANLRLVKHPLIPRKICKHCASILLAAAMMRVNCVESNKFFMSYLASKDETPLTEHEAEEFESQFEAEETESINVTDDLGSDEVDREGEAQNLQKFTKVDIVKHEPVSLKTTTSIQRVEESKGYDCQNCRLCLKRFPMLPGENTVADMKDVINKIMDMKSFERSRTMIPDKVCDDCLGKVLTASIIADRCKKAYKYFYSKSSAVIKSSSCMVCLKDYQSVNDICAMSDSTYSYMHYFASRNSDYEYQELQGEKRICLRCMHDLEVANSVRYKNWKAEELLEGGAGKMTTRRMKQRLMSSGNL